MENVEHQFPSSRVFRDEILLKLPFRASFIRVREIDEMKLAAALLATANAH
jgi:hypothetical protein